MGFGREEGFTGHGTLGFHFGANEKRADIFTCNWAGGRAPLIIASDL